MLELIVTLLLAFHLLAMNLASAGPLALFWIPAPAGPLAAPESPAQAAQRRMLRWSLGAFVLGMVSGVLQWQLFPGEGLTEALRRFPLRALSFAGIELLFSLVCLLTLARDGPILRARPGLKKLLAVFAATNLLYHFPPLMAIIGQLAANPHWTAEPVLDRSAVLGLMTRGHVLAAVVPFRAVIVCRGGSRDDVGVLLPRRIARGSRPRDSRQSVDYAGRMDRLAGDTVATSRGDLDVGQHDGNHPQRVDGGKSGEFVGLRVGTRLHSRDAARLGECGLGGTGSPCAAEDRHVARGGDRLDDGDAPLVPAPRTEAPSSSGNENSPRQTARGCGDKSSLIAKRDESIPPRGRRDAPRRPHLRLPFSNLPACRRAASLP